MPRKRDPNFLTGLHCHFCGEAVPWGTILRLIHVNPDAPPFTLWESACHTECLRGHLRPKVELSFHRHWNGRAPMLDDDDEIDGKPCAMCAKVIDPPDLVRFRVQKPAGPVKQPLFDEFSFPLHFDCLAAPAPRSCSERLPAPKIVVLPPFRYKAAAGLITRCVT